MDDAEKKEDLGQEQSPVNDTIDITEKEQPQVEAPALEVKEQEFVFKFTETEVNLILRGLGELPTKIAYNFVGKIITEIDKQKVPK